MKKWMYAIFASFFAFGMAACSDDPSIDSHPKEQIDGPDNKSTNTNDDVINKEDSGNKSDGNVQNMDTKDQMEKLPYSSFDLEVKYGPDKEYEYDYEAKDEGQGALEAELYDSVNDKRLKGQEAFQTLYTLMQDIKLDENSTKDEAVKQVLDTFQLDENYTSFELEYTMKNGTKKEFEDRK